MTASLASSARKTADLRSIPDLKDAEHGEALKDPQGSFLLVQAPIASIAGQDTKTLLLRLQSTSQPLVLWALHVALDAQGVPPCLRPRPDDWTEQTRFITTLADLLWIAKRHPDHKPLMSRHRDVFGATVPSDRWHKATLYAYQAAAGLPHLVARNLALSDEQRRETRTLATKDQLNPRRTLEKRRDELRDELVIYATKHPDRANNRTPTELADRRMAMVWAFVMLGRDIASTLAYLRDFEGITNEDGAAIDRRTLRTHLVKAATICRTPKLILG